MKIAVGSQNQKTISGHGGKTSKFLIYTIDTDTKEISTKELIVLAKEDILPNRFHESPNPWAPQPIYDVDILIIGGVGMGIVYRLAKGHISSYHTVI